MINTQHAVASSQLNSTEGLPGRMKEAVKILTVLTLLVSSCRAQDAYLPFIMLNMTEGVETLFLPRNDDGVSEFIFTENPIPFGNSIQHYAYVSHHYIIVPCSCTTVLNLNVYQGFIHGEVVNS